MCDIYDASDLNGDGAMDYNEFKLLQSLFMPEKVNMKRVFDQCKDQVSGCLNKKQFVQIAMSQELFSFNPQKLLLKQSLKGQIASMELYVQLIGLVNQNKVRIQANLRQIVDQSFGLPATTLNAYYGLIDSLPKIATEYSNAKVAFLKYKIIERMIKEAYVKG